ncbi:hypothetical protein [Ferrimicrobium sp.]|uniref:YncE family protein n=1 Tax=Ferrimicrobium sp. TaxID=2926050 RepID=UPI00262D43CE|nr:hypothetical protein [Ferrimicrobium sp.]
MRVKFHQIAMLALGLGALLGACGTATTSTAHRSTTPGSTQQRPSEIIPVSSGALAMGPLQSNGTIAVLAGTEHSKGVFLYDIADHQEIGSFSVSNLAQSITQLPNGDIAIGFGGGSVGAVQLYAESGRELASVPVAEPVLSLSVGSNGGSVLVLEGTSRARAVALLDVATRQASSTIPVALQTVAIASSLQTPNELYGLGSQGIVAVYTTTTGQEIGDFTVGHSGRALAMGPGGNHLFVLKGSAQIRNVAVVDLATERDVRVLPAPKGAVAIQTDLTSQHLIELASLPNAANIQVASTS